MATQTFRLQKNGMSILYTVGTEIIFKSAECKSALITKSYRPGKERNNADPAGMCDWLKNILK
jgi:hypothetical protein